MCHCLQSISLALLLLSSCSRLFSSQPFDLPPLPSALSSSSLLWLISHLPFVIHHVPDDLEVPQVIIAQQLVLLGGVEQRKILHNNGYREREITVVLVDPDISQYKYLHGCQFKIH